MAKQYTYKFRIYPNAEQITFLNEQIGCNRFIYNFFLERTEHLHKTYGIKYNYYESKKIIPLLKKGFPFLKNANSQSLQATLKNLDTAFRNFFRHRAKFPNFKKKTNTNSISIPQHFDIDGDRLYIPKLKDGIKVKFHRRFYETVKSVTITKTSSGKYYANMLVEKYDYTPYIPNKTLGRISGADAGIKDYLTITEGTEWDNRRRRKIDNPKYLVESGKKLVKLSRQLDKKQHKKSKADKTKTSSNYKKFSKKIAKLHEHISNQRKDFLHKLSSNMVNDSQVIVIEDLNIKGMVKNRHLSMSISDAGWSMFYDMLAYKAGWFGRYITKVNRFYPSSKKCSIPGCGYIYKDLKLSEREWVCPQCGTKHDRDGNASDNMFGEGLIFLETLKIGPERSESTPVEHAPAGIRNIGYRAAVR
ncbi:MAG: RNA-guided endonuclease TnpB family protein [bacterium]